MSYENAIEEKLTWTTRIENTLSTIGLREQFLLKDKDTYSKALQRLKDIFQQEAFSDIQRDDSKLRTYSLFKTSWGYEQYLSEISSIEERTALTKLRLSNHALMIEKGRHVRTEASIRFCPFCPTEVEDEQHFLMKCKCFSHLRKDLFIKTRITAPFSPYIPTEQKFITLMNNSTIIGKTAQYIFKAFELREFLLAKCKVHD